MPPATQDLVDGSALLECALSNDLGSHLLHVKHERIEGFLDDWLLSLLLCLGFCLCFQVSIIWLQLLLP